MKRVHVRGTPETFGYKRDMLNGFGDFVPTKSAQIKVKVANEPKVGQPVMVSLGAHVDGACLPIPDPASLVGVVGGLCKRNCTRNPPPNKEILAKFEKFVGRWLRKWLVPLEGKLISIRQYLAESNYPLWRQLELLDVAIKRGFDVDGDADNDLQNRDDECIQFVKRETYRNYKECRLINSRTDAFKVFSGRFFHMIEQVLYKLKWFIKHWKVTDRPGVIAKELYEPGVPVKCTDYSSFESMFIPEVWSAAEGQLYRYMAQNLSQHDQLIIQKILAGVNVMKFRSREGRVCTRVDGTRMSGDMCTSLGNGFTNLMMFLFVAEESGVEADGFVEGDDGIFLTSGPICSELFAALGATIKIKEVDANEASFCGNIFDLTEQNNVVDPIEKMVGFGWSTSRLAIGSGKNHAALLRAKALSLRYEYPHCPILLSMANWVLRCVPNVELGKVLTDRSLDQWQSARLRSAVSERVEVGVTPRTRELVESIFGVSRNEQLMIEDWFDKQTTIRPIPISLIWSHVEQDWIRFWDRDVTW